MGDYTKLIVHAEVRVDRNKLEAEISELGLCESAYHCDGVVNEIEERAHSYEEPYLCITLIGQTKYGVGQEEFLDWLAPYVSQGSGPHDIWAIQFDEYADTPRMRKIIPVESEGG